MRLFLFINKSNCRSILVRVTARGLVLSLSNTPAFFYLEVRS